MTSTREVRTLGHVTTPPESDDEDEEIPRRDNTTSEEEEEDNATIQPSLSNTREI